MLISRCYWREGRRRRVRPRDSSCRSAQPLDWTIAEAIFAVLVIAIIAIMAYYETRIIHLQFKTEFTEFQAEVRAAEDKDSATAEPVHQPEPERWPSDAEPA